MKSFKMTVSLSIALTMAFLCCAIGVYAHNETLEEDIIIVARNYVSVELSNTGVVMGSKKGRFQPAEFKGVAGTTVLLFMYNRISRDKCVDLVSNLYEMDPVAIAPRVDHVLGFLKDNKLLLTSKYPNPSRNFGMNKFRIEEQ
ncbi:MAG: hypothetical protein CVU60_07825 [Deltaproteobacteria bacterium HGW-Deltaproteobacteria-18]|nr:MAG: hypothetical protein CVU60_07825 [Deltaproteobacteria bacterium HGW-Deltaproteobacteria-18]